MSESTSHLNKTLEDFKRELSAKLSDIKKILALINMLEDRLALPLTPPPSELTSGALVQDTASMGDSVLVSVASAKSILNGIRPDEYLGQAPLDAAKIFLRRVHRAVGLDEIAEAVQKGGALTTGSDWKEKLDASLLRSTREVVKVQNGIYGLAEFYTLEQLKALRGTRPQRPKNDGKKRRRGRPKKRAGKGKIAATKKEPVPSVPTAPEPTPKKRGRPPKRQDQQPKAGEEKAE